MTSKEFKDLSQDWLLRRESRMMNSEETKKEPERQ